MKTLRLHIAGIEILLRCDAASVLTALREQYRPFLSPEPSSPDNAPFTLEVQLSAGGHLGAVAEKPPRFRDGGVHFVAPECRGAIHPARGEGEVRLSTPQPVEDVDYILRIATALLLFRAGGLLFHAAGIVRRQRTFAFFGHSGSGKTTVARLSTDDVVLNDDLIALLPKEGDWVAHATPFWKPEHVRPHRHQAPLAALLRLTQSERVRLAPMSRGEALAEVISNVPVISADPARGGELLTRCQQLLAAVPTYRLHFRPDPSFWPLIERIAGD